jgi:hypothetical protein
MGSLSNDRSWGTVRAEAFAALRHVLECAYCGKTGTDQRGPDERPWSIDHVVPTSRGGSNRMENLVKCCHQCNSRKGRFVGGKWEPGDEVMTAAGVAYGSLLPDAFGSDLALDNASVQVAHLQAEINYLKMLVKNERAKVNNLERYVWEVSKTLGDISLLATHAKPMFEIGYNASDDWNN